MYHLLNGKHDDGVQQDELKECEALVDVLQDADPTAQDHRVRVALRRCLEEGGRQMIWGLEGL